MARHELRQRPDGRFELRVCLDMGKLRAQHTPEEAELRAREETDRLWKALAGLDCPTLVVRGAASDVLSPETADRMEAVIPQGQLVVVPRAGHSVMVDNPEGLRDAVSRFALGEG
jgi:pimeloyl-ACP methyl ester carboxylesterase